MSNVGRVLTFVVSIYDESVADEFWKAHGKNLPIMGVKIRGIAEGDVVKERDHFEEYVTYLQEQGVFDCNDLLLFEEWKEENT